MDVTAPDRTPGNGGRGRYSDKIAPVSDLISIDEARRRVLDAVTRLGNEDVPLDLALGRVLAEDVTSGIDVPPFDSSGMDGYALIAGPEAELEVIGEARAGHPAAEAVRPGTAIRISTGAVVPEGADAVVPVERTTAVKGSEGVRVPATEPGANIRRAGEDIALNAVVLQRGTVLGPAELGVAASVGRASLRCARRPRVFVLITGDELTAPGEPLAPGAIYGSNGFALAAQVERAGGALAGRGTVPDTPEGTRAALEEALDAADVVIVSGGVSVGPHDHVKAALSELGVEERFWGVRLRPGKPTWFGARGDTLAFGLPGNPVSAMVTFQLFARPALAALQGAAPDAARASAVLGQAVARNPRRDETVRVRLRQTDEGLVARADGRAGLAHAHLDARRGRPRADPPRRRRDGGWRARGDRAPVRPRDPRRLLERQRRAGARVAIVHVEQPGASQDGAVGSKQVAEVTLPRAELEKIWSPEYLERLARTYWSFLSRFSLGLIRVLYSDDSREVVFLTRPFVLLRFHKPEYEIDADGGSVTWPIDRGVLVARRGRGRGFLRLGVRREPVADGADEVTLLVSSEVVNFYPTIATGLSGWLYEQTQLRIHVIVTHAFLRSLANLDLEPSRVGALRAAAEAAEAAITPSARQ